MTWHTRKYWKYRQATTLGLSDLHKAAQNNYSFIRLCIGISISILFSSIYITVIDEALGKMLPRRQYISAHQYNR